MQKRDHSIDEAIRRMYPSGLLDEPNIDHDQMEQVSKIVRELSVALSSLTSLQICHQPRFGGDHYFSFAGTLAPAPHADEWISSFDRQAKLAWVANTGAALPVWWAHFSFVFPVWEHYFNLWAPRPSDPSYLDANWTEEAPTAEWDTTITIADRVIAGFGFSLITREEQQRPSENVHYLTFDETDKDDRLHYERCNIGQCLFSEC